MSLPFPLPPDTAACRKHILQRLCAQDPGFRPVPVRSIQSDTLALMLALYDEQVFSGFLSQNYRALRVTLSARMISAAGKFIHPRQAGSRTGQAEIRMSSDFLFRLSAGPFRLNGLAVDTPQEAFLIVFEHELCHALEYALFGATGHSARFRALAFELFGHTGIHHSLPTRREEAAHNGLFPGVRVAFPFQERTLHGTLSYAGKNATVMVPDPGGAYRDRSGRRFAKYRVPLPLLKRDPS